MLDRQDFVARPPVEPLHQKRQPDRRTGNEGDVLGSAVYQFGACGPDAIHILVPFEEVHARCLNATSHVACHRFRGAARRLAESGGVEKGPLRQRGKFGANLRPIRHDGRPPHSSAARRIAARLISTSVLVVAHEETLMRMAVRPCHSVTPHQQTPSCCTFSITALVTCGGPKETSTWLMTTSFRIS